MLKFLISFQFLILFTVSQNCKLPNNITIKYTIIDESLYLIKTTNNCFNPTNFENRRVNTISIEEGDIPTVPEHFIEALIDLNGLELNSCGIKNILPRAFVNLPKLDVFALKGNKFSKISKGVFDLIPSTYYLQLENDEIFDIEDMSLHIQEMQLISLSGNPLINWNQNWFGKLDKLENIRFEANQISTIQSRAFSNFPNLKKISLKSNKIVDLQPEAFEPLSKLELLDLRGNQLTTLNPDSFPSTTRIDYFLLTLNHLNFIPQALLNKLYCNYLHIDFNPWTCSCLDKLNQWAHLNNVSLFSEECFTNMLPVCVAYKPTCTEEENVKGTESYLGVFRNLNETENDCVYFNLRIY